MGNRGDELVRMFRDRMEHMSQEELATKLGLDEQEDEPAGGTPSGTVSFDYTIKGINIIRLDMDLLKKHGITWDDTVKVILIKKQ